MIAVAPVVASRTASPLRRKMLVEMRVRHLSPRTEEAYVRVIEAPSGLRVSEVVRLQPGHIEIGRMMVFVKGGKGAKDRYTVLSERALERRWGSRLNI